MIPTGQLAALDDIRLPSNGGDAKPARLAILGVTGTIGRATIDVALRFPERFKVEVVTANTDAIGLAELARKAGAARAILADENSLPRLRAALEGSGIKAAAGRQAMLDAISAPVDTVMAAIVGTAGLETAFKAVQQGMRLALANKECLVAAAPLFRRAAAASGAAILPIDSEHSAVFQALCGAAPDAIEAITLTASGGPFRTWSRDKMAGVTPQMAVKHPNWSMGAKISVDSATLMNKGLELIEAAALFPFAADRLNVVIHPQSIVHGLVAYRDGSVMAQLSAPDMRIPIAVGLAWPERIALLTPRLNLAELSRLEFEEPDRTRFPALALAETALAEGNGACLALNAANEIAVDSFLTGHLPFLKIADIVETIMAQSQRQYGSGDFDSLEDVLEMDLAVRHLARGLCAKAA